MKSRVIILFGSPGAGKGTQAELVSERFNFYYLETSKIIESNVMRAGPGENITIGGKNNSYNRGKWAYSKLPRRYFCY